MLYTTERSRVLRFGVKSCGDDTVYPSVPVDSSSYLNVCRNGDTRTLTEEFTPSTNNVKCNICRSSFAPWRARLTKIIDITTPIVDLRRHALLATCVLHMQYLGTYTAGSDVYIARHREVFVYNTETRAARHIPIGVALDCIVKSSPGGGVFFRVAAKGVIIHDPRLIRIDMPERCAFYYLPALPPSTFFMRDNNMCGAFRSLTHETETCVKFVDFRDTDRVQMSTCVRFTTISAAFASENIFVVMDVNKGESSYDMRSPHGPLCAIDSPPSENAWVI